jgi:hypothetical protein
MYTGVIIILHQLFRVHPPKFLGFTLRGILIFPSRIVFDREYDAPDKTQHFMRILIMMSLQYTRSPSRSVLTYRESCRGWCGEPPGVPGRNPNSLNNRQNKAPKKT